VTVQKQKYGEYAFLIGLALAIIVGVLSGFIPLALKPVFLGVLALLGLVVGLFNVTEKEITQFLIAAIALLAVPSGIQPMLGLLISVPGGVMLNEAILGFISALGSFIAPAAFVNAVRAIYYLARSE
jgi:uncharacterized membrane protein